MLETQNALLPLLLASALASTLAACGGTVVPQGEPAAAMGGTDASQTTNPASPTPGSAATATATSPSDDASTTTPAPRDAAVDAAPVIVPPSQLSSGTPQGTDSPAPGAYQAGVDPTTTLDGASTMKIASTSTTSAQDWDATGGGMTIDPSFWGERYRVTAQLKTQDASAAFLWFRIDTSAGHGLLDNMMDPVNRAITGTTGWQTVALVLDVPKGAVDFAFGSGLEGTGEVWVGPITVEQVSKSVPKTPSTSY